MNRVVVSLTLIYVVGFINKEKRNTHRGERTLISIYFCVKLLFVAQLPKFFTIFNNSF